MSAVSRGVEIGKGLSAEINYADVAEGAEVTFSLDHGWSGFSPRPALAPIRDADQLPAPPSLDREGFMTAPFTPGVMDYDDPDEIEHVWRPAVHELVKRATGAALVVSWAFGQRFSERSSDAQRSLVSAPARRVHSDFSPTDFVGAVAHPAAASELRKALGSAKPRRWRCFNVWQPISPPPYDAPLAVCDTRTVAVADIVPARALILGDEGPVGHVDLCLYRYSAEHAWFYFSGLRPNRALIFNGIDPARAPNYGLVPHTAVDDPTCPPGARPRNSIEIRTLALFD